MFSSRLVCAYECLREQPTTYLPTIVSLQFHTLDVMAPRLHPTDRFAVQVNSIANVGNERRFEYEMQRRLPKVLANFWYCLFRDIIIPTQVRHHDIQQLLSADDPGIDHPARRMPTVIRQSVFRKRILHIERKPVQARSVRFGL